MRFEAKNSHFKDLAHRIKNYKNIPKSLAQRHQAWSCYVFSASSTGASVLKNVKTGPGISLLCMQESPVLLLHERYFSTSQPRRPLWKPYPMQPICKKRYQT